MWSYAIAVTSVWSVTYCKHQTVFICVRNNCCTQFSKMWTSEITCALATFHSIPKTIAHTKKKLNNQIEKSTLKKIEIKRNKTKRNAIRYPSSKSLWNKIRISNSLKTTSMFSISTTTIVLSHAHSPVRFFVAMQVINEWLRIETTTETNPWRYSNNHAGTLFTAIRHSTKMSMHWTRLVTEASACSENQWL